MDPRSLAESLLEWYARVKRDLPWRRTRDPWAIWVSEVMLQQTRVEAVRASYERFLAEFPTPEDFAAADDDTLLNAWRGLGYYRRARLLRDAAQRVVAQHEGRVPETCEAFGALPGVGSYTRGAVLSIAFDQAEPAIDGNVERVMSRLLAIEESPKRRPAATRIADLIADFHEHGSPGDLNQALMELGATVCVPRNPSCLLCPWAGSCVARASGRTDELPRTEQRKPPIEITTSVCVVTDGTGVLGRRVPKGEINEGQLCLPGLGVPVPVDADLAAHLAHEHALRGTVGKQLATVRHSITKYRIRIEVFAFERHGKGRLRGLSRADPRDAKTPWTTVARKVFAKARVMAARGKA